jgi:diketogulonate reductase-like aldo/keto reductase
VQGPDSAVAASELPDTLSALDRTKVDFLLVQLPAHALGNGGSGLTEEAAALWQAAVGAVAAGHATQLGLWGAALEVAEALMGQQATARPVCNCVELNPLKPQRMLLGTLLRKVRSGHEAVS